MSNLLYIFSFAAGFAAGLGIFRLMQWGRQMALRSRQRQAMREPMMVSRTVREAAAIRPRPRVLVPAQKREKSALPDHWLTPGPAWTPPSQRAVDDNDARGPAEAPAAEA